MGIRRCLMAILLGDSYPTHMWFDCFVSYKVDITNQSCAATSWWFQIVIELVVSNSNRDNFLLQIIYYSCQRFTYYPWSMYVDTSGSLHGNKYFINPAATHVFWLGRWVPPKKYWFAGTSERRFTITSETLAQFQGGLGVEPEPTLEWSPQWHWDAGTYGKTLQNIMINIYWLPIQ